MSEKKDPFDGEYIGNIFGPKLTRYGLIIILLFTGIALYRHWSLGVGFGMEPLEEEQHMPDPAAESDTLRVE